ncbi:MAG: hypothetical protein GQ583_07455 [Methyloprofundus sp.]|nr:hypothetical protein [Methyloprofundus sp.]
MKKIVFTSLTALVLLSSAALSADEITEQMNDVIKAYQAKDYKGAIIPIASLSSDAFDISIYCIKGQGLLNSRSWTRFI